jgi:hypothetical protein
MNCFNLFLDCLRGGVRLYLFILIFFTVEGEGVDVNVFFPPSFDMQKEQGKRVSFFFFSLLSG